MSPETGPDLTGAEFGREGRVWLRGFLDADTQEKLRETVAVGAGPGLRLGLADISFAADALREASAVGGAEMHLVRALGFAKTDVGNWGVPWHQDRVISVSERRDVPGYGNWSCKRGVWHCEPPVRNLQRMTFLRVFLDEVTPENGGMEYAVGSHAAGRVADSEAVQMARKFKVEVEEAEPGDVLVLHMLTLHRSSPSLSHLPRRVLRVDAAGFDLPAPLQWAEQI